MDDLEHMIDKILTILSMYHMLYGIHNHAFKAKFTPPSNWAERHPAKNFHLAKVLGAVFDLVLEIV